jgi:type II secretory pathway pseudopilin PulG
MACSKAQSDKHQAFALLFASNYPRIVGRIQSNAQGLTLVELLVSLLLISFAIVAAASIISYGVFGLRKTESNYDTQNLIDRDLSTIEDLADRYTCIDIPCTVVTFLPKSTDQTASPDLTKVYVDPSNTTEWAAFSALCEQTTVTNPATDLISPLAEYIEQNLPNPSGVVRDIKVSGAGSDVGIGRIKHFTVQYRLGSSTGPLVRNSTVIPTIVSYCP